MTTVWIVSLEWNFPPSEVTGDTGIVGVYATEALAQIVRREQQQEFADQGRAVYNFPDDGDNEDDWFIDVHCTEHDVQTELRTPTEAAVDILDAARSLVLADLNLAPEHDEHTAASIYSAAAHLTHAIVRLQGFDGPYPDGGTDGTL